MGIVENAIRWMEQTAADNRHGYDQQYRWGERGDYDCSSAVITAWQTAGIPVRTKGASYTGNMHTSFLACGFKDVTAQVNLITGAGLVRGDVLLNRAHHTAMYCGNGLEVEASINEKGKTIGGMPGDQTGKEFLIRMYRNYPWDYVLRYIEPPVKKTSYHVAMEVIRGQWGKGNERQVRLQQAGYRYKVVQALVNAILRGEPVEPILVAELVLNGVYGNGKARIAALQKDGWDPVVIQQLVNQLI